jgi:predicted DNA-binding protein
MKSSDFEPFGNGVDNPHGDLPAQGTRVQQKPSGETLATIFVAVKEAVARQKRDCSTGLRAIKVSEKELQMVSVSLPAAIEQRLAELAKSRGVSEGELARELIEASLEDIDDIEMVTTRLENRQPPLTDEQARKALGLDD